QDLAPLIGERVAALGRQVESPRTPVEDRLAEEEDAGERRHREGDAQPLRAQPHRRPRHWRASSTRRVAHTKKPAANRKEKRTSPRYPATSGSRGNGCT